MITAFHTFINRIPVFFTIKEKLTGTDHTVGSAKLVQIIENRHNLFCRVRRARLLSVTEGCVRDPDILRHIVRHDPVIEGNLRDFRIREHIAENIGLFHIIQNIHMLLDLEEIILMIHSHGAVLKLQVIFFSHVKYHPSKEYLISALSDRHYISARLSGQSSAVCIIVYNYAIIVNTFDPINIFP